MMQLCSTTRTQTAACEKKKRGRDCGMLNSSLAALIAFLFWLYFTQLNIPTTEDRSCTETSSVMTEGKLLAKC